MGAIEHMTISLPADMAGKVRDWVASGEFPDIDAAVLKGLRGLEAGHAGMSDVQVDAWIRQEVLPAIDRYDADPSQGLSGDQVRARLAQASWARESSDC